MNWRYEVKFSLRDYELLVFENWLMAYPFFRRSYPTRLVNSIYLDTPTFDSAGDNLSGIAYRTKFRLRWYGKESTADNLRFEIKIKNGRFGRKVHAYIPVRPVEFLKLNTQQREKIIYDEEFLRRYLPMQAPLSPILLVRYEREYFQTSDSIRITIDRDVRYKNQMLDKNVEEQNSITDDRNVVEFKFAPEDKEEVCHIMSSLPFYPVRNSKYMLGLAKINRCVYI